MQRTGIVGEGREKTNERAEARKGRRLFTLPRSGLVQHMVGHKTVGPHLHSTLTAPFRHQAKVSLVVLVGEECLLTPITTLCEVMR